MSRKKKYILIIGIGLIIIISTILGISFYSMQNKEPKKTVIINENENFTQSREYEKLTLSDVKFGFANEESTIVGNLTNNSDEKMEEIFLKVILLDEQKNKIGTMFLYTDELEAKSSKQLTGSSSENFMNAYDYYIEY